MSTNTLKMLASISVPFYASELGFSGSTIGSLKRGGYISPTGNTKMVTIILPKAEPNEKDVEVKEWIANQAVIAAALAGEG